LLPTAVLAFTFLASAAHSDAPQAPAFERRELTIPMRDGTKLFAIALIPAAASQPLPIMLIRTPYGAGQAIRNSDLPPMYRELAEDGYIFVVEDVRGRYASEGNFIINRAQNDPRNAKGTNESTDAYDTIDWLVKHLPKNSGRVGVMGISYGGWLAGLAGVGAHPALKAISPQAPTTDTWMGDDFFHQGAFRQTQAVVYAAFMEFDKAQPHFLTIPEYDQYDFYLKYPTLASLAAATGVDRLPSWVGYRTHPAYDGYWQAKAMQHVLVKAEVPILFVGGWWDQEDILGPQLAYRTVERTDARNWNRIVLGPWYHGGWARPGGDSLGPIRLGSSTADWFRERIQRPWFAYYLHGKGDGRFPEAWAFETGANEWRTLDAWPPRNARPRNIYLREGGRISFDAPGGGDGRGYDAYVSDPARPVPYMPRPDDGNGWQTWMERDQRFVDNRPDVLTWKSEPLTEDLTIAGNVVAHLFASTTGSDADWVVKLIDVYPETVAERPEMGGYELIVNADIMRGRYWKGFTRAVPIPPNTVTPFTVDLHEQLYRFRKGHRLMVQVQSSWFPLYDRNPQTFVPSIFEAKAGDFRVRTHRVWHTGRYPSHITVLTLGG
jgi:putative CocE/NonD family hydrolase